ncbi:MAG: cysteine synthase A [bacterium]
MKFAENITELIGETPLLRLNNIGGETNNEIYAKLEAFNPSSSVKDRIAVSMITQAEKENKIDQNTTIVEPTSGNTGIGLASVSAARGYQLILTMPESMSEERRALLKALGAKLVLTPADGGMPAAIDKAEEIVKENENTFMPQQFNNPANPAIHYQTTGPEIWQDTGGRVDALVAGIGTGGTITGTGKFLKEKNPKIEIVGIEPAESPVLSGGKAGPHSIQGIGAGFVPEIMETELLDEVIQVQDKDSIEMARKIAKNEGLLVGISSGAALAGTLELASKKENKRIVTIFPDAGDRYLSTDLFKTEN